MINLKELCFNDNKIKVIPKGISCLISLQYLSANDNLLTTLPENLNNLKNLKIINISGNKFEEPPRLEFGQEVKIYK